MSSSKVIKVAASAGLSDAEPFVMKSFRSASGGAYPVTEATVGGELVDIEREAYAAGFATGEKAGFELGRKKAEVLFQGLGTVLDELSNFRDGLYKACEEEIVDLTLAIAKKVVQHEMRVNEKAVVESVKSALSLVVASSEVTIRVNSKDLEVIHQYKDELERYTEGVRGVKVDADDTIERGGVVIETNYGEVDATVTGILSEIEERLNDAE